MVNPKSGVQLAVAVAVIAIVAAFLAPVAINEINGTNSATITQNVTATTNPTAELNATLDSIGTGGTTDNATYTLEADGVSTTKTIDNGTTATFSFDRGDVNVTVNDVDGVNNAATSEFEYNNDFSYSDGAQSLWELLGLMIVLGIFLVVLSRGMDAMS